MFGWFKKRKPASPVPHDDLRAVPVAGVYRRSDGQVIYNMLDPTMQQFLGRCVGAIKQSGIRAKGTGQFSVLLGDTQTQELRLDKFWSRFSESQDQSVFDDVVASAREMVGG